MRTPYAPSAQQWAAISAPLEPAVVIAGAGSGKTTLMAARVVYLVVTGQVRARPGARPDLHHQGGQRAAAADPRRRCAPAGLRRRRSDRRRRRGRPRADGRDLQRLRRRAAHRPRPADRPRARHPGDHRRRRATSSARGWSTGYTGEVEHLTDHPETAIQNLLALDGAMSEHLVSPDDVRALDAEARHRLRAPRSRTRRRQGPQDLPRADREGDLRDRPARRAARPGRGATGGSRRDLGLMDFSDQIELGARLASEQPEVGASRAARVQGGAARRVPGHLGRPGADALPALLRADAASAAATRSPRSATPTRRSTAGAGASVSNILNFARDVPRGRRRRRSPALPADGQPALRRAHPRGRQPRWPRRSTTQFRAGRAARAPSPSADAGRRARRGASRPTPTSWPGWSSGSGPRTPTTGAGREIGVLTRDNAHAADVFDALTAAGIPVEIVGLSGLLRLPEVAEVVATLHLLHDLTANAVAADPAHRPALGDRPARPARCSAGAPASSPAARAASRRATASRRRRPARSRSPTASTRPRSPSLGDALDDPGDAAYSAEARERFALLPAELRHAAHATSGSRCSTSSAGSSTPPASTSSWPPRSARPRRARRDNLDLFVKAVAEFQAVDGDVSLPALLAYLTAEDDQGNGLDVATPTEADSVKLLTVHRAKGLEWDAVFLVGVCETRFPSQPVAHAVDVLARGAARRRCAATRATCRSSPGYDKAALTPTARRPSAHEAERGAAARATSRSPGPGTGCRSRRTSGASGATRVRARRRTRRRCATQLAGWGEPVAALARTSRTRATPTRYDGRGPLAGRWPDGRAPAPRRGRRLVAASASSAAVDRPAPDDGLDMVEAGAGRRLGRRARPAARRGPARPAPTRSRCRCRRSLSATALARLRDDPDALRRASWPGRCRARRRRPPGSAPGSTPGSRRGSASSTLLDPDELPGRGRRRHRRRRRPATS